MRKRQVEMGVQQKNSKGVRQELNALILDKIDVVAKPSDARKKEPVQLLDMDQEEDRDKLMCNEFMKKYSKIWKMTFQRYANQAYSTKSVDDFDKMKAKNEVISVPEVTNIMKKNKMLYKFISKEEISSLVRLVALHNHQGETEL